MSFICNRWVEQSVKELEVHSRIFDEMGFLPASPYNKINIHVGGTYGDKEAALRRFSKVGSKPNKRPGAYFGIWYRHHCAYNFCLRNTSAQLGVRGGESAAYC
jgi:hypothetical protein